MVTLTAAEEAELPREAELALLEACRAARLTPLQTEIVLRNEEGYQVREIRSLLKQRYSDREIKCELRQGHAKLWGVLRLGDYGREFPRLLVFCAEDRRGDDERPADMSGVTPARASDRFQGARVVTADHPSLRQDLPESARLWARARRTPA